jgi:hypothetical protein
MEAMLDCRKWIQSTDTRIDVIGFGSVGLPLVIEFCQGGFRVTPPRFKRPVSEQTVQARIYRLSGPEVRRRGLSMQGETCSSSSGENSR